MFGESESESPRTGSPWDGFLVRSSPASPAVEPVRSPKVVPKLVPEVEEGNVEYKLRLLNPSEERFTRLVTQLKWRLLEGGGQAYYELGVADSGQLVGLSRTHLERSLQTLEEMAGEIGASVIVVKEIELPPALVEAVKNNGSSGKIADGAMRMHKVRVADYVETPPSSAGTDEESELSTPEIEDEPCFGTPPTHLSPGVFSPTSNSATSSRRLSVPDEAYDSAGGDDCAADLEIASVYKPRPQRRRTPTPITMKPPKVKRVPSDDVFSLDLTVIHAPSSPMDVPNNIHSTRRTGDWKKTDGRRALHTQIPRLIVEVDGQSDAGSEPPSSSGVDTIGTSDHFKALDDLEAAAAMFNTNSNDGPHASAPASEPPGSHGSPESSEAANSLHAKDEIENESCSDVMHNGVLTPDDPTERRYIVEALVVRKMSLEEAFLDFVNI